MTEAEAKLVKVGDILIYTGFPTADLNPGSKFTVAGIVKQGEMIGADETLFKYITKNNFTYAVKRSYAESPIKNIAHAIMSNPGIIVD